MIRKQDILDRATEWALSPDVVEKDYVLGWVLAAIATHAVLSNVWVFKGGTCLKKCCFETYRFSEDLDFTLLPDAPYDEASIRELLRDVARTVHELSGIDIPVEQIIVIGRQNKQGNTTFEARISYNGPLQRTRGNLPRIRFDLTRHEPVRTAAVLRPISHPFPDDLPQGEGVRCYSIEELLAEKTRALVERTRPRDLYDVVNFAAHTKDYLDLEVARTTFRLKCEHKGIEPPSADEIAAAARLDEELRADWSQMLAHQLPALPDVDVYLDRLCDTVAWVDGVGVARASLGAHPLKRGETLAAPRGIRFWGGSPSIEATRFAGSNLLKIAFDYHGKHRVAEPYSLRRPSTGNLLLYAWEDGETHIKAFKVHEIRNVRVLDVPFVPRYRIEL